MIKSFSSIRALCASGLFLGLSLTSLHLHADDAPEAATPVTLGMSHLGLTVRDLDATSRFFTETLGWKKTGEKPDYPAVFVTDGKLFLSLWRATDPEKAVTFDRKNNIGLHHVAFTVADIETLNEIHEKLLKAPGVRIEFAPENLRNGPTMHMMAYEPSGNRVEFIAPGGKHRAAQ